MIGQQAAGSLGWSLLGQVADGGDLPADAAGRLVALLLLVVLLLVVLFTAFFLVRSLQRARQRLLRKKTPPTESSDVWSKHRLPSESDE